jgi:hypothetical protein
MWSRATDVNGWSSAQIRRLRELALQGFTVSAIAAHLRRSESAIRNKAGMHGISLRSGSRATSVGGASSRPGRGDGSDLCASCADQPVCSQ